MISVELLDALIRFRRERDWEQFHSVKNLSAALTIESSELLEIFQWSHDDDLDAVITTRRKDIEREVADIAILLSYLCHDLRISVDECVRSKLIENAEKYPISKARGTAKKYDRL